jgi:RES domain-containing protein
MNGVPLQRIEGRFYRAIKAEFVDRILDPPPPNGSGRYHAPGQPALYMTVDPSWARFVADFNSDLDGARRVVLALEVDEALVFDQRDEQACIALGIDPRLSSALWRPLSLDGGRLPSWDNADAARSIGAEGIIDPSREILGGWHVVLFRWNELGGPSVRIVQEWQEQF